MNVATSLLVQMDNTTIFPFISAKTVHHSALPAIPIHNVNPVIRLHLDSYLVPSASRWMDTSNQMPQLLLLVIPPASLALYKRITALLALTTHS